MTGISWTDVTWNPVRGCQRVSEGCRNCYAEAQAGRIVRMGKGKPTAYDGLVETFWRKGPPDEDGVEYDKRESRWTGAVSLDTKRLAVPLSWRAPRKAFVDSMSDLFYDGRPNEDIAAVFGVMAATRHITYQILTKYARRAREWFAWVADHGPSGARSACRVSASMYIGRPIEVEPFGATWPLPNVWLGVSVENRDALHRLDDLRAIPAALRMVSFEPLLEDPGEIDLTGIGWVIAGCESGPGARPCDVAWLRALRDQCAAAEVPFWLKQARATYPTWESYEAELEGPDSGGYASTAPVPVSAGPGSKRKPGGVIELAYLDGVKHAAFPQSTQGDQR